MEKEPLESVGDNGRPTVAKDSLRSPLINLRPEGEEGKPSAPDGKPDDISLADYFRVLREAAIDDLNRRSIFRIQNADEWIRQASLRPDPVSLWGGGLWFEHEVCCLFADTNVGKSILAVQMAEDIAADGHTVLYFDFEMTDKQFQLRYTDPETRVNHQFPKNFLRVEMNADHSMPRDIVAVFRAIEEAVTVTKADTIIIDNLSWICNETENGEAAGELMQLLCGLKRERGLSILVLAHTPKRAAASPITQNSLAGSKKIANFMDSIFAIGRDHSRQPAGRYLKQIKVRSAAAVYHDDACALYTIRKQDARLMFFSEETTAPEYQLLENVNSKDDAREELRDRALQLRAQGFSIRRISEELGIAKTFGGYFFKDR
ncbi:MAG: AAA family ATPase [Duncaniella sp.]|nr:AAA family ATPase [Duncaniella sp.]